MTRWALLTAAAVSLGVGVYFFAIAKSLTYGVGSLAESILLTIAAKARRLADEQVSPSAIVGRNIQSNGVVQAYQRIGGGVASVFDKKETPNDRATAQPPLIARVR